MMMMIMMCLNAKDYTVHTFQIKLSHEKGFEGNMLCLSEQIICRICPVFAIPINLLVSSLCPGTGEELMWIKDIEVSTKGYCEDIQVAGWVSSKHQKPSLLQADIFSLLPHVHLEMIE